MSEAPTIVILHGWGLSKKRFEPLIQEFESRNYKVYAPDFPGFGECPPPERPFHLKDYAIFLESFLKQQHILNPVIIGHSFGGRVGLRYNTMYPKSIRTLILTGTPGITPTSRKKLFLFIFLAKFGKVFFSIPGLSFFMTRVRTWYYHVVGAKEFNKAQGVMKDTFKHIVQESLIDDMKHIEIPCYLIWGEDDVIVPVSIAKKMNSIIKGSELVVIPQSDHGIPFKKPNTFVNEVEKILQLQ